ncbi:hypothetical protein B4102_3413 [Heyndrickxia sporothermodurans]|uniref:Uncharacterized protein n=1 Tax=Heyndrickxia sporothermodurans TaxID=46224 RepID=A0A150KT56_9BACI|nr:hypothetical protein B4102_3413 [Heyndrickxia sporothermodurans]
MAKKKKILFFSDFGVDWILHTSEAAVAEFVTTKCGQVPT